MSTIYDSADSSPSPYPTQPGKLRWLWLTLGLCGVAVLSASAGALLAVGIAGAPLMQAQLSPEEAKAFNQDSPIATGNFRLPRLTRPVNILILGVKVLSTDVAEPPPETQNLGYQATINSLEGLSDSMLLLRFNPQDQQLVLLSLPRDTRTYVEGAGVTKLNEANALGGPSLAARSTSDLLGGVEIDRYIRINVLGVEKLIDALGGVTVYVPQDMKYQDDSQHLYINLKQGEQHLNGTQAVQFLRFRHDDNGDIGRVQRQQMFLRALREQALKPATLARLPQILSVIQANIDTNLKVEELVALAGFASQIDRSEMQMLMLPGAFSGGEFDASYWLPSQEEIYALVRQYFDVNPTSTAEAGSTGQMTIAVQDSTGQAETVEWLTNFLMNAGYSDVFLDTPWTETLAVTRIIAQHGDAEKAQAIRQALGFGEVLVESTGSLQSDITIRLGQDALRSLQTGEIGGGQATPTPPQQSPAAIEPPEAIAPELPVEPVPQPEVEALSPPDPALEPTVQQVIPKPKPELTAAPQIQPSVEPALPAPTPEPLPPPVAPSVGDPAAQPQVNVPSEINQTAFQKKVSPVSPGATTP